MTADAPSTAPNNQKTPYQSPRWSSNTKIIVAVATLILLIALALRFTSIIRLLTIAAILAYLLNPIVAHIDKRTRLNRGVAIALVYLSLVVLIVGGSVVLGVSVYDQVVSFINQIPSLIADFVDLLRGLSQRTEPITLGPFSMAPASVNWDAVINQLLGYVEPTVSRSGSILTTFATTTVSALGQMFFIFIISIYLAAEIPNLGGYVARLAQRPGYQRDAELLMHYSSLIWSSYLRGQVILGLVIGFVTGISLAILGLQYSLAIGVMAGLLEFVPNLGPIITAVVAIIVALLQSSNYWGLSSVQLALATLGIMIVIQQLENNLLVPRIVGNALNLHPLLVLLGVLMGASLAGILGAILAAPLLASIKLIGTYVWRKMFDLPPFTEEMLPPDAEPPPDAALGDSVLPPEEES
ncbi:MAG: AI-2E family transporter [Ardenticatenaceae bacterium]|nr:AI-2E family transporter [Ardenticatenaceae bacterium]MCB8986254.1 AI-2E family transporter [Ardenticatenaceae bacterium]